MSGLGRHSGVQSLRSLTLNASSLSLVWGFVKGNACKEKLPVPALLRERGIPKRKSPQASTADTAKSAGQRDSVRFKGLDLHEVQLPNRSSLHHAREERHHCHHGLLFPQRTHHARRSDDRAVRELADILARDEPRTMKLQVVQ